MAKYLLATVSFETRQEWIVKPNILNLRRSIYVLFTIYGMHIIAKKIKASPYIASKVLVLFCLSSFGLSVGVSAAGRKNERSEQLGFRRSTDSFNGFSLPPST